MSIVGLDPSLFASDSTSAAFLIWQYMQGFANIAIIIILLVVIISQLTGYGIDNYGVKRILPKLIITAILINLSFILCQVLVDLSNIIGSGLKNLFVGIGDNVLETLKANGVITANDVSEFGFSALFTGIFGIASGAAVALPIVIDGIMLGATFWWIPLIFVALIGLISIVIFFLLLSARKLLAVVLVAISPLALVCYVLPNTKGLFDKWLEAFKGVLIVYPVCGALYGISKLMKVIAFSADGIHIGMMIVALLSTFVPFIVAPKLIKQCLAAFGELGGFISRMGESMKGGVRGANDLVKGSAMYQDAKRTAAIRRSERGNQRFDAAKRRISELTQKEKSGAVLSRSEQRELNRAKRRTTSLFRQRQYAINAQSLSRSAAEDVEAARITMREETGNYDTGIMGAQLTSYLDRVDGGETLSKTEQDKVYAIVSQLASQSGGAKKIYEAINNRVGASAQMIGAYMAQNDRVRSSVENKGRRVAARIGDIASGTINANTSQAQYDAMNAQYLAYRRQQRALGEEIMSETDWKNAEVAAGRTVDNTTVIQAIARDVLDKDKDFVTQSGGEVTALVGALQSTTGGQARIDRMASDTSLFGLGDVAEGVRQTIQNNATPIVPPAPVPPTPKIIGTRTLRKNTPDIITGRNKVIRVRDMDDGRTYDLDTGEEIDIREYS